MNCTKLNVLLDGYCREQKILIHPQLLAILIQYCEESVLIRFNDKCELIKFLLTKHVLLQPNVLLRKDDNASKFIVVDYRLNGLKIKYFGIRIKIIHIKTKILCSLRLFGNEESMEIKFRSHTEERLFGMHGAKEQMKDVINMVERNVLSGEILNFEMKFNTENKIAKIENGDDNLRDVIFLSRNDTSKQEFVCYSKFRDYCKCVIKLYSKMDCIEIDKINIDYV